SQIGSGRQLRRPHRVRRGADGNGDAITTSPGPTAVGPATPLDSTTPHALAFSGSPGGIMRRITSLLFVASLLSSVLGAQQPGTAPAQGRGQRPVDPRTAGGGQCSENPYNCIDTANPLTPPDTVWLEEMTW